MIRSLHIDTAETWRGGQNQVLLTVTGLEQNQVLLTVTGLEERGHPAVLVGHAGGELSRRAAEGLRFIGFSPKSEFDAHAAWQLNKILRDVQPAVIHAHDPMGVALTAMALTMGAPRRERPLVVAARRVDFHLKRHAFSKWKYRQVDVFIAASHLVAGMLKTDGIPAEAIETVHDGVDIDRIDRQTPVDAHAAFWLPRGAPVVGNVAALVAHKGQRFLVGAAALVTREVPDARFLIIGEGELRAPLERQIRDVGLERHVLLPGFRSDVLGLQSSFDVFAMSSVTEGLGSAMLDAMAGSRAVAATRAGGIPEAIDDGKQGLLVPPHDESALAQAIVRLLRDPALRLSLGAAARQRIVEDFSVERMVTDTLRVYESRLNERTRVTS
jgi:glycosyltransferase involved in cell wall biosynthesis